MSPLLLTRRLLPPSVAQNAISLVDWLRNLLSTNDEPSDQAGKSNENDRIETHLYLEQGRLTDSW